MDSFRAGQNKQLEGGVRLLIKTIIAYVHDCNDLRDENQKQKDMRKVDTYTIEYADVPQQQTDDCGIFALLFFWYSLTGHDELDFTSEDIDMFRRFFAGIILSIGKWD